MGCWEEWKPVVAMLIVNVVFAITSILVKKSLDEGTDRLVLVTLRYLVAALFMLPVAYVKERKTRPKLTFQIFGYLFLSATLGCALMHYLFYMGMQYTTATFACAFFNVTPVLTFLIAIPFRLESATVKTKAGVAKVLGAVLCFAGALVLALYKGIALTSTSHQVAEYSEGHASHSRDNSIRGKWMLGTVMLVISTFSLSAWYLLQSKICKRFPALCTGTTIMFSLSFLQAAVLSFATKRDISLWVLKSNVEIITIAVSGIGGSVFCYLVILWCVEKRGSLFTTAFVPLILVMVAGIDAFVLHEQLHLGSVVGSIIVVSGLYSLLWGKNKEARTNAASPSEEIHTPSPTV
ncbi:WAT1-related protein-like [Iris pallida]|uniref:WAT1-related protein n=1 Tax=Iris pallida TaxID=29817 RepID=A0AAX6IBL9_IRIPA|nr:WAT1-related protein-like [Iris pallida]KAJ6850636.1 WAT1-related protein-like [Iris pallida]